MSKKKAVKTEAVIAKGTDAKGKQEEIKGVVTKTKLEELKQSFLYVLNDMQNQKEKMQKASKDLQSEMTERQVPVIHTVNLAGVRIRIEITSAPCKDKLVVKKDRKIKKSEVL